MPDPRQELLDNFVRHDRDGDGYIDYREFCSLMAGLQSELREQELRTGFDSIDGDGSGRIDFEELARWLGARPKKWKGPRAS